MSGELLSHGDMMSYGKSGTWYREEGALQGHRSSSFLPQYSAELMRAELREARICYDPSFVERRSAE